MTLFIEWRKKAAPEQPAPRAEPTLRLPMKISDRAIETARARRAAARQETWRLPTHPPGVLPPGLAQDEDPGAPAAYGWASSYHGMFAEGIGFLGYPYLAELTQRAEYRVASELIAEEMTRKWLILKATGDKDKSDKIQELTADLVKFKVRDAFRAATELDGFFGLSFIKPDFGEETNEELMTPLLIRREKIEKGSLKGFIVIDPTWSAPNIYNAQNALDPGFYRPITWFVMGKQIHHSRLMIFVSRPVPDILKPAYNFGGLSLSQMMKPYVDNWLRTRQSVADLVNAFTQFVLKTNISATLQGDAGADMDKRISLFAATRDNRNVLAVDKNDEDLANISAPLGTLDALQAQSQEHQAAVVRAPLVKLFGITPSGLNASTDGEIRTFYDSINGRQERLYNDPFKRCLDIIQLNRYGEIDPDITHEWVPLWQLDEAGQAAVYKTRADTAAVYIESGVLAPEDERTRVAAEPGNPYHGLEGEAPGLPEAGDPDLTDPSERVDVEGEQGSESGANSGV